MNSPRKAILDLHAASGLAIACLLGGCAGSGSERAAIRVSPAAFRGESAIAEPAPVPAIPVVEPVPASPGQDVIVLTGAPGSESSPRTVTLGATDLPADPAVASAPAPPPPSTGGYLIDAFLGQVNGKPIYADAFLEPMDARLGAEAERLNDRDWQRFAASEIARALRDLLQDELLLAEFRASLTPEERIGIGAFIDRVRQGLISESGGSREVARTRLEEAEGLSLSEKVDDEVKRAFIREQIRREIADSVSVTFRDIEVYYDLHPEEFAPPGDAVFRIIQVPASDGERIARVEAALASGTPFEEIAGAESDFNRSSGGELSRELDAPRFEEASLFAPAPLNEAARKLTVGRVTDRVDFNDAAWWIKLERLDREEPRTLYEAQFEIEQKLKAQRFTEAERRYFQRIVGRAGLADQEAVAIKLLEFAARRHRTEG